MHSSEVKSLYETCDSCTPKCRSKIHQQAIRAIISQKVPEDYLKAALFLLCQNFYRNFSIDQTGGNLIHWAATCSKPAFLHWLFKNFDNLRDDSVINGKDSESNYTPLHTALLYGNILCAQELLKVST